jgi:hypothetical protein
MTLKKKQFSDDEIPLFDNAVLYKRGEFWQMRMWLGIPDHRDRSFRAIVTADSDAS